MYKLHPHFQKSGSLQKFLHPPQTPPSHGEVCFLTAVHQRDASFFHYDNQLTLELREVMLQLCTTTLNSNYWQNTEKFRFFPICYASTKKGSGAH